MKYLLPFVLTICLVCTSCATKTRSGALAGGVIGTGVGATLGGGKGAIIGGASGVAAGAVVGHYLDEQDRKVLQKSSPTTIERVDHNQPLSIQDIIKISQAGVSDEKIIQYMKDRKTVYNLTQEQITKLKQSGVGQRVIAHMVNTGR